MVTDFNLRALRFGRRWIPAFEGAKLKNLRRDIQTPLSPREGVAKGKIVWAGNMLPVAVRATRPPLPKFDETPFFAQYSPYFYQNDKNIKTVGGSPTLQQHTQTLSRQPPSWE